jgi:hypothetical protein
MRACAACALQEALGNGEKMRLVAGIVTLPASSNLLDNLVKDLFGEGRIGEE